MPPLTMRTRLVSIAIDDLGKCGLGGDGGLRRIFEFVILKMKMTSGNFFIFVRDVRALSKRR